MATNMRFNLFLFVLAIPVIHAIATIFTPYFPPGTLHPGSIRALLLIGFLAVFCCTRFSWSLPNTVIAVFLAYYMCLVFIQSSEPLYALYQYVRFLLWALMFPVGYYFFQNLDNLNKLNYVYIFVLAIFVCDLILANLLGYGDSSYGEETLSYGGSGVNITKTMGLILLMAPIFYAVAKKHNFVVIMTFLFLISGIFILLGLKRSALVALVCGLAVYLLLAPRRIRAVWCITALGGIAVILSPLYIQQLFERYERRQSAIETVVSGNIQEEGRFDADIIPAIELWWDGSLKHKLFGSEVFNTEAVVRGRNMHVDYARTLVGSGLIGLILFMLIYMAIALELHKYFRVVSDDILAREIYAVFWALLCAVLIMGLAGTLMGIGLRAILFFYWGAMVGVMRSLAIERIDREMENVSPDEDKVIRREIDSANARGGVVQVSS